MARIGAFATAWLLLVCGMLEVALAAEQRYDYDSLGRLVRSVGDTSTIEYVYDAAGNLLEVKTSASVSAPTVTSVNPVSIRRGSSALIRVEGSGFSGATVAAPTAGFTLTGQKTLGNAIEFDLAVANDVPVGTHAFSITNAAGSANFTLSILAMLPVVSVSPLPLAVAPDGVPRSFNITLSNADATPHTVNLAIANTSLASVNPSSVTIPAGQTSVIASITGLTGGSTVLTLNSATLKPTQVPVFVTAEFAGINTSNAPLLGVVLEKPAAPPVTQTVSLGSNADLGVVVGGHILGISPSAVVRGTSTVLTIAGKGLAAASAASIKPAEGVTLGSMTVAPDGSTATVPITVTADAPIRLRQLVLVDASGKPLPAARADSDRFAITYPAPVVESITPVFGTVGSPVALTLRGRNLQQGKVQLVPGTGIQVDDAPVVTEDGLQMTFRLGIQSLTAQGEHLIRVVTPGGTSQASKGPENTFTVVTNLGETISPIMAPPVGVVLETPATTTTRTYGLGSFDLGVARGPVITDVSPRVGIVGETVTLTLQGQELTNVSSIAFSPAEGLTVQPATPAADGKSLTVSVAIAGDAPKTVRALKAYDNGVEVPFSDIFRSQFLVSAPLPRVDSVSPVNMAIGSGPISLTIRGANFKDAKSVAISPAQGITVSQPPIVSTDGTVVTVDITIAPAASAGQRVVSVVTPAGSSDTTGSPGNTLHLVTALGNAITPILSPALGVVKLGDGASTGVDSLLVSPHLGVVLQAPPAPPVSQDIFLGTTRLGVALGPIAKTLAATPLQPGASGSITVQGVGLTSVNAVSVHPGVGVTLGSIVAQSDGLSLSVPIALAADTPVGVKEFKLNNGAAPVYFGDASAARFVVATGEPRIDSISPILARQGETVTLTIRGAHLNYAKVIVEPASGVVLSANPEIAPDGTQLTLGLYLPADAALGARVIRVQTPGGLTTDQPEPANTFTVFPP